jgi:hypothetical protein
MKKREKNDRATGNGYMYAWGIKVVGRGIEE